MRLWWWAEQSRRHQTGFGFKLLSARETETEREREGQRETDRLRVLCFWLAYGFKVWSFNLLILLLSAVAPRKIIFLVFVLINRELFFIMTNGVWDFVSADH